MKTLIAAIEYKIKLQDKQRTATEDAKDAKEPNFPFEFAQERTVAPANRILNDLLAKADLPADIKSKIPVALLQKFANREEITSADVKTINAVAKEYNSWFYGVGEHAKTDSFSGRVRLDAALRKVSSAASEMEIFRKA